MPQTTPCYAVVCVLSSFALQIASLLSNDGCARWDGWVGSLECCECMSELSLCPVWWLLCTDVLGTLMTVMPQQLCSGTSFPNCSVKMILFFKSWLSALPPRRGRQQHQQRLHDKESRATLTSENFIYLVFRSAVYHIELTLLSEDICATS